MSDASVYVPKPDRDFRIESAVRAMHAILSLDLHDRVRKRLLNCCIWQITEADGKKNLRYRSEGARRAGRKGKLIHEHVNERKKLIEKLIDGSPPEEVVEMAVGCLVTPTEHQQLSRVPKKLEGWDRYRAASLRVYDIVEDKWMT